MRLVAVFLALIGTLLLADSTTWPWFAGALMCVPVSLIFTCHCCTVCIKVNDQFTTDTSADYDVTGTWSHSGGQMHTTVDGSQMIHKTELDEGKGRAEVIGKLTASGGKLRVYGAWTDANNHLYAELTRGSAFSLEIYQVSGGVTTQLGATAANVGAGTSDLQWLYICWNGIKVSAWHGSSSFVAARVYAECTLTGKRGGFGADPGNGQADIEAFAMRHHTDVFSPCVTCDPCVNTFGLGGPTGSFHCTEKTQTTQVQIDIDSLADGSTGCDCSSLNGLHIVDIIDSSVGTGAGCGYLTSFTKSCGTVFLSFGYGTVGDTVFVEVGNGFLASPPISWGFDRDIPADCSEDLLDVPLTNGSWGNYCVASDAVDVSPLN